MVNRTAVPMRRIGSQWAPATIGEQISRSSIGRIANALVWFFIAGCLGCWFGAYLALAPLGIKDILLESLLGKVALGGLGIVFVLSLLLFGMIGNAIRKVIFRILLWRK